MHGVQAIGVTGGCVVDVVAGAFFEVDLGACRMVVVTESGRSDEAEDDGAEVEGAEDDGAEVEGAEDDGAEDDEAEGVAALHPARIPAVASTTTIRTRDPKNVLATRESVARPSRGRGAPPGATVPVRGPSPA